VTLSRSLTGENTTQLHIEWDIPSDKLYFISSYKITLYPFESSPWSINVTGGNNVMHDFENLTAGESYSATVQSVSEGEASPAFSAASDRSQSQRTGENKRKILIV